MLLLIVAGNVGCDQLSKNVVRKNISQTETMHLLNNHLVLMNVENTGAFLSLGTSLPSPLRWLTLSLFPVLALTVALFYLLIQAHFASVFCRTLFCNWLGELAMSPIGCYMGPLPIFFYPRRYLQDRHLQSGRYVHHDGRLFDYHSNVYPGSQEVFPRTSLIKITPGFFLAGLVHSWKFNCHLLLHF